jgi:hypothetical protein
MVPNIKTYIIFLCGRANETHQTFLQNTKENTPNPDIGKDREK